MVVPFRQITASVCPPALELNKFVRRHLRLPNIASADAVSDNQKLARRSGRQKVPITVNHHHLNIRHRLSDGNLFPCHLVKGTANGGLRRPIPVEYNSLCPQSPDLVIESLRKCLCAHVKHLNLGQGFLHLRHVDNINQEGRRTSQDIHPVFQNQTGKSQRIMDFLLICHADRNPVIKGDTFLQNGYVEGNSRKRQGYRGIIDIRLRLHVETVVIHIVDQILVLNHYPLRFSSRT